MTSTYDHSKEMIETVAKALGDDLLDRFAFVGGSTTGLLITDEFTKEEIRYTDDVDLIVGIVGHGEWATLQGQLREKGFIESMEDNVICRMRLDGLKVDFMPDDETILGFTNRWYTKALETSQDYELTGDITIKLLSPPMFIATKLEAYLGRGDDDPMGSHDLEDILNLIDGREELLFEIKDSDEDIRTYIANQIGNLLTHADFDHTVQSNVRGDKSRADMLFERLEDMNKLE